VNPKALNLWLIDDDDFEHMLVAKVIEREKIPFRLRSFLSVQAAQDALETIGSADFPALIFCDLNLPVTTGFDFLVWLRASPYRGIPVIIRSNSFRPGDIGMAYDRGATAFYTKANTLDEMAVRLRATHDYWRHVQLPPPDSVLEQIRTETR
jgi:CheY-like chemotaxis protein